MTYTCVKIFKFFIYLFHTILVSEVTHFLFPFAPPSLIHSPTHSLTSVVQKVSDQVTYSKKYGLQEHACARL